MSIYSKSMWAALSDIPDCTTHANPFNIWITSV